MSKTIDQLLETTTTQEDDFILLVDKTNDQDKKIKMSNLNKSKVVGELYVADNTTDSTTIAAVDTGVLITNGGNLTPVVGILSGFSFDVTSGKLTYGNDNAINVSASFNITLENTIAALRFYRVELLHNGVVVEKCKSIIAANSGDNAYSGSAKCFLSIVKDDYFQLQITNVVDDDDVYVVNVNLNIEQF